MSHHYNRTLTMIIPASPSNYPHYDLIFTNSESGEQVRMQIPRRGLFEDPTQETTPAQAQEIAEFMIGFLNDFAGQSSGSAVEALKKKRRSQKG